MKCESAQEWIVLHAYGELADEQAHALELHLAACEHCRKEQEAVRALQETMALAAVEEPSPNLVARARVALDDALDNLPERSWAAQLLDGFRGWGWTLRGAPVLAALLVGVGLAGGGYISRYQAEHAVRPRQAVLLTNGAGEVASVSGVVQTPDSDLVQVNYNRVVPESIQGTMDDPQIKQLLLLATQNHADSQVRASSVSLLADQCRTGNCGAGIEDNSVRKALMVSLRYDKSPTVRMKALDGLQPYVGNDRQVRDAILEALMHDSNADVRSEAVGLLTPVQADSSVQAVMHTVSTQDQNPYIRNASRTLLQQVSEIQ